MQETLQQQIQDKVNNKTKPPGSLGLLEKLAFQIASVQNTLSPELTEPHIVVFAGSHGIAASGVSAYPSEVTPQMVLNFIDGGAAINVFTRQHNIKLLLADAGVDYDFVANEKLINAKINYGTKNFLEEPAMTAEECRKCLHNGAEIVQSVSKTGCNVIGFGEMGIGNTSSAATIMSKLLDIPIADCVGKGTGLDDLQVLKKIEILKEALIKHRNIGNDPLEILQTFGGFEIAMMCSAMLEAANQNMIILVDGFIASVSYLCAFRMNPLIKNNAVFCHQSDEKGHRILLEALNAEPVLKLGMRLGEGTGALLAVPLLRAAARLLTDVASLDDVLAGRI